MDKKEQYIEKAKAKIDELIAKLDVLKAKAKGEIADQKIKTKKRIEDLEAKLKESKQHLSEIIDSAGDDWEKFRTKFDILAEDIGNSFKKFFSKDEENSDSKDKE